MHINLKMKEQNIVTRVTKRAHGDWSGRKWDKQVSRRSMKCHKSQLATYCLACPQASTVTVTSRTTTTTTIATTKMMVNQVLAQGRIINIFLFYFNVHIKGINVCEFFFSLSNCLSIKPGTVV